MRQDTSRFDDRYVATFLGAWLAAMISLTCGTSPHEATPPRKMAQASAPTSGAASATRIATAATLWSR